MSSAQDSSPDFPPRTLVIAPEPPWPTINGVRTKLAGFVKQLGGSVDVISPPGGDTHALSRGATWTALESPRSPLVRARAVATGRLPIAGDLPARSIMRVVRHLLDGGARYDVIHLDTMATAHLAAPLRQLTSARGQQPMIVASLNDSYSLLLSSGGLNDRLRPRMYCHYVKGVERRLLPDADWVDVVSEHDLAWLREVVPACRPRLIPLGIEIQAFAGPRLDPQWDMLYLGTMSAPAFYWLKMALDTTLGRIRSHFPQARFAAAGPDATPEAMEYFRHHGVQHLGFVEDLSALLRSTRSLLVSSRQRAGTPTKALQAMAAGTPVVGMEALDGIPNGQDNMSFSRATDWDDLGDRVLAVLSDDDQASRLGEGGQQLVARQHDWHVVHDRYFDFGDDIRQGHSC